MRRFRHLFALIGATALIVGAMSIASSPVHASVESQTFDVPGTYDFLVPAGVTAVTVDAYGSSGGSGGGTPTVTGGLGGHTTATIAVTPGETLKVVVGGAGQSWAGSGVALGGSNGGGDAGGLNAGGGGGATDVRQVDFGLAGRVVVAGGGGGGGAGGHCDGSGPGGVGGGEAPTAGSAPGGSTGGAPGGDSSGGAGGTGHAGSGSNGTAGVGGAGGINEFDDGAGGGGGGWYGGGGGGISPYGGGSGGGGGSAFAVATATAVSYENGVRSGSGKVVLTWIAPAPTTTTTAAPTTTTPPTTTPPTTTIAPPAPAGPVAAYGSTPGHGETSRTVSAGGTLEVNSSGWQPGSSVTATMYSTPVRLGEVRVDATGSFVTEFSVPASAANGSHRLELTGIGADGQPAVVNLAITVTGGARSGAALSFVC